MAYDLRRAGRHFGGMGISYAPHVTVGLVKREALDNGSIPYTEALCGILEDPLVLRLGEFAIDLK
jgi:hypothetical protein